MTQRSASPNRRRGSNWDEVTETLKAEYGSKAKVAVLPDATMGIPEVALKT